MSRLFEGVKIALVFLSFSMLIVLLGSDSARESIERDCKEFGAFVINGTKYTCEEVSDGY